MDSSFLLGATTLAYLFSTMLYVIVLLFRTKRLGIFTTWFTAAAFLLQTAAIGLRWLESYQMGMGHAPLTNLYESVVFCSWSIMLLYLFLEFRYKAGYAGAFIVPLAFLLMAYSSFSGTVNKSITPLIPALQSNWLISHVVACFVGYAAFAVAAGLGIVYLVKGKAGPGSMMENLPEQSVIDQIIHKTMIFGFIWLTAGIITGSVWANSAWGTYWSWDPKETWSLITWFFYAITLHARYIRSWNGSKMAWMSIVGLFFVLFTYYGVNFLLSGLHSYGYA